MTNPTLAEVAQHAGVAVSTASRVLSGSAAAVAISPATVARVQAAARRVGYVPNAAGRLLRTGRSETIGVLGTSPESFLSVGQNGFATEMLLGLMRAAVASGYHTTLLTGWPAGESRPERVAGLGLIDGLIVLNRDLSADPACAVVLRSWGKPVVWALDHPDDAVPSVSPDDEAGGRLITRRLLDLGHRRIAFAATPEWRGIFGRRRAGWRAALAEVGMVAESVWELTAPITPAALAASGATACVCANSGISILVQRAAVALGWSLPARLALATFDVVDAAGRPHPHLAGQAMVAHPLAQTVAAAVHLLIDLIEGRSPAELRQRVPYAWIDGASVAPPGERGAPGP
jgi:LacI family transcriptional regulator